MKWFLLLFLGLLNNSLTSAQNIDSMMNVYSVQFPQQKVYIHFDKGVYRAGESIWFKVYVFAGPLPALNSRNFYAELIDVNGNVLQRKTYPISESSASGTFEIPENFEASVLRFRGYTGWMLNFDSSFHYTKDLAILSKIGKSVPVVTRPRSVSLRFFPEGGNLVNTLESVVAFKANDNYGLPVKINGTIRDSKGETIAALNTLHDGMGTFKMTPLPGEIYTATYTDDAGIERKATLPVANHDGVVLQVSSSGSKKIFVVKRPVNSARFKSVRLVAHIAQHMVYKARVPLENSLINSGSFAIDKYPSGVMQFTLFSEDWQPIAERVTMVNNNDYALNATLTPLTVDFNKRAKNVFEIEVEDTLLANLSMSVTDEKIQENPGSDNIISRLLLSGDLKGYVHKPAYYFSDSIAFRNVDLVMLTNGWRRYNWNDVVMNRTPLIKFPDTSFITLNAKVYGTTASSALRNDESITAVVQAKDSGIVILEMPKTGANVFSQPHMVFYDTVSVHYQFAKNKRLERKVTVKFDNGLYEGFNKIDLSTLPIGTLSVADSAVSRTRYLGDQIIKYGSNWAGRGNVLETVTVKTRSRTAIEELDKKYTSGLFSHGDAYTFDFVNNNTPSYDLVTLIQSKVPGIQSFSDGLGQMSLLWRNSPVAVYVDEMLLDASMISNVSIQDIAYVKVFRPPFFGAFGGGSGGAVAIYTRRGGENYKIPGKSLALNKVAGYASIKEFYSPDYSTRSGSADVVADYRSTLYWNPLILTNAGNQKIKIEFYNNDITTAFRVILEGFNEQGKLVRIEKVIK